jgi:multiple sugar transport system permease protein
MMITGNYVEGTRTQPQSVRSSRRRSFRRSGRSWQIAFLLPAIVFLAVAAVYPLLRLVQMSVSDVGPATLRLGVWKFIGVDNFIAAFKDMSFGSSVAHTVIYTVIVLVLALVGGFFMAIAIVSGPRIGRPLTVLMLFAWLSPPVASALTWKFILSGNGLLDSVLLELHLIDKPIEFLINGSLPLISVAFVNAWVATPFAAIIIRAALLDIPPELYEQASIDGARNGQKLRFIVLPMLRPTFFVLGLLLFVYAFKSFDFIYSLTQGGPGTASTTLPYLSYQMAFNSFEYGEAAAVAVVTMLLVGIAAFFYIRSLRREN